MEACKEVLKNWQPEDSKQLEGNTFHVTGDANDSDGEGDDGDNDPPSPPTGTNTGGSDIYDAGYLFAQLAGREGSAEEINLFAAWLMDSASNYSIAGNDKYLTNIRESKTGGLRVTGGGKEFKTNKVGTFPGWPKPVWFVKGFPTNVLSLGEAEELFDVDYEKGSFTIKKTDGKGSRTFYKNNGLFASTLQPGSNLFKTPYKPKQSESKQDEDNGKSTENDTEDRSFREKSDVMANDHKNSTQLLTPTLKPTSYKDAVLSDSRAIAQGQTFVAKTVEEAKSKYTPNEVTRASRAREVQSLIGHPSYRDILRIVDRHLLKNISITRRDVVVAEDIFCPSVACLKGKTTRRKTPHADVVTLTIPPEILLKHKQVVLAIDIFFVNGLPFLFTK